jgi:hypothetical protein
MARIPTPPTFSRASPRPLGKRAPRRSRAAGSAAQALIVVELRRLLEWPLDEPRAVTRRFIDSDVSRSGLNRRGSATQTPGAWAS